ncbi:hypothetical protein H696_03752 [Fonticula alba]|uniref:type I protein arginine methyltransferase n=1 Tax=Fonticula alba TaxID=691883 RepID=A0A058Z4X0_FONAL|nr:hypothetical protein H696_03752 [Fonticula alba]KCV69320.1 hypothetical protein H696_03752 [Fonticula alba]|eukprot:XP_009495885.1 hypothetical protein H696_03752 [Fonticula alba]
MTVLPTDSAHREPEGATTPTLGSREFPSDNEDECPDLESADAPISAPSSAGAGSPSDEELGDEASDWSDWEADEQELSAMAVACLFCPARLSDIELANEHMATEHGFDLRGLIVEHSLDFYTAFRLANLARKHQVAPSSDLPPIAVASVRDTEDQSLLLPVVADDMLLVFLSELVDFDAMEAGAVASQQDAILASVSPAELLERLTLAERRNQELLDSLASYKEMAERALKKQDLAAATLTGPGSEQEQQQLADTLSPLALGQQDRDYFDSYGTYEIHEEMLRDTVRTESYRSFIEDNAHLIRDKIVLDVGCGTGILSMFAARAGAKHVYAVDASSGVIPFARSNIKENGFEDKITVIFGKVEEISLPVEKVDIIISEWMGYFLLFESMFDSVIAARDRWLADDGHVLPSHARIFLCGAGPSVWAGRREFWSDVYGFKMPAMWKRISSLPSDQVLPADCIATNEVVIFDMNARTIGLNEIEFTHRFSLTPKVPGTPLRGLCGFFDIDFWYRDTAGAQQVSFSTSPEATTTHWRQTFLPFSQDIVLPEGVASLDGQISVRRHPKNPRELLVTVDLDPIGDMAPAQTLQFDY